MNRPAIQTRALGKSYGDVAALTDIDLAVAPGERLALLGHNGAGKTTLIKLVLGLLRPSRGEIEILGQTPGSNAVRAHCAYLPENLAFHKSLTGDELMRLFCRLKGRSPKQVPELLDRVGLLEAAGKRLGAYSKGMRQRLGLAQLLIGSPRLVVLDEPTTGLDPLSRQAFYDIIADLAEKGAAIVLSSHVLTELEARTDRIVILRRGRIAAKGRLSDLRSEANLPIRLHVEAQPDQVGHIRQNLGGKRLNGCAVELLVQPAQKVERLAQITAFGGAITDIDVIPPSLEDLYRHYGNPTPSGEETP